MRHPQRHAALNLLLEPRTALGDGLDLLLPQGQVLFDAALVLLELGVRRLVGLPLGLDGLEAVSYLTELGVEGGELLVLEGQLVVALLEEGEQLRLLSASVEELQLLPKIDDLHPKLEGVAVGAGAVGAAAHGGDFCADGIDTNGVLYVVPRYNSYRPAYFMRLQDCRSLPVCKFATRNHRQRDQSSTSLCQIRTYMTYVSQT